MDRTELRTPEAIACLAACRAAVEGQKAVFPLAFPAVTEAIEIPARATRLRHADLLDALWNGVTLRSPQVLLRLEAEQAYRWLLNDEEIHVSREDVLTSLPDHLGEASVSFPADWTPEEISHFMTCLADESRMRSIRYLAEQRNWGVDHTPMRERYVREMEKNRQQRLGNAAQPKQAAFSRALLGERVALVKQYLIPAARNALLSEVGPQRAAAVLEKLRARKGEGGERRVRDLFARMPMMDQYARLLALDAMEVARRPRAEDFYDFDHGTGPPIYGDAFVTRDKRLTRLVRDAGRGSADLVTSLADLERWLKRHCADGRSSSSCGLGRPSRGRSSGR